MVFVVLGMHKSGTTVLAQTLHASGICMGCDIDDRAYAYDGNQCESPTVNHINNLMLGSLDVPSPDIRAAVDVHAGEAEYELMQNYVHEMSCRDHWGIKDPRLCLTYRIWKNVLPRHALVFTFRHPAGVWLHYRGKHFEGILRCAKALARYVEYNEACKEIYHRHVGPRLCIDYDSLMINDEEQKRLSAFFPGELYDVRNKASYRNGASGFRLGYHLQRLYARALGGVDVKRVYHSLRHLHEVDRDRKP